MPLWPGTKWTILLTARSESAMTLCVYVHVLRAYGAKVVGGRRLVRGRKVTGGKARAGVGAYSLSYLDAMPEQLYPDTYSPP